MLTAGAPISFPRRLPAHAQPWHHPNMPAWLWEHTVSEDSCQPLLKLPSAVASQSKAEIFIGKLISGGVRWIMEGITESKYPLHYGLSDLRHPSSSSVLLYPTCIQQRPNSCLCLRLASRQELGAHRSPEIHLPSCYKLSFSRNPEQRMRCPKSFCPTNK